MIDLNVLNVLRMVLDFTIVTYLIYILFKFTQNTKAVTILKGVSFILGVWLLSGVLGLNVLKFILSNILIYGMFVVLIIFQPEIRTALESLGRKRFFNVSLGDKDDKMKELYKLKVSEIDDLVESLDYMSKRRIGALISIEITDSLDEYIETGIKLDSVISKELLINIFSPNAPLHDGALIIKNGRIESGSCYLPLSESTDISKDLGTRHRAAIGLSELEDSLTLLVSEETGAVSIAKNGKLYRGLDKDEYRRMIEMLLGDEDNSGVEVTNKSSFFSRLRK